MRFICRQQNLLQGLSHVAPLAGRNRQLPILQYVLCQAKEGVLHLTCTDLEIGARVTVAGKVEDEGIYVINARKALEYVQQLPTTHPLTVEMKDKEVLIATEGFRAKFPTADVEDFPLLPTAPLNMQVEIPAGRFCQGLIDTMFAAAREETRPEIHSVFITGSADAIRLAATDSFRLVEEIIARPEGKEDFSFLLPLSAVQEVIRLFDEAESLSIGLHTNYVTFRAGGTELSSRLIEGKYPDYKQIIPQQHRLQGLVDKDQLWRALKTLAVFLPRDSRRVTVRVEPEEQRMLLEVGGEIGQGAVEVAWQGEGEPVEMLFNIQYLLDGMQHLPAAQCQLSLGTAQEPAVFRPTTKVEATKVEGERTYVYVVMPIQL